MKPSQGEFSPFFLHAIAPGHGVHPQPAFDQQPLPGLHTVLQLLGQVAPAHHFQFTWRITLAKGVKAHGHLRNGSLVVLGVSNRRCVDHLHFEHAMVHGLSWCRRTS